MTRDSKLDSFGDFCGRARTVESLTNDLNLFNESFKASFESFALKILSLLLKSKNLSLLLLKYSIWTSFGGKQYKINFCNTMHADRHKKLCAEV
jgi:hypothetical protein